MKRPKPSEDTKKYIEYVANMIKQKQINVVTTDQPKLFKKQRPSADTDIPDIKNQKDDGVNDAFA